VRNQILQRWPSHSEWAQAPQQKGSVVVPLLPICGNAYMMTCTIKIQNIWYRQWWVIDNSVFSNRPIPFTLFHLHFHSPRHQQSKNTRRYQCYKAILYNASKASPIMYISLSV
jgi:hypothetical protein